MISDIIEKKKQELLGSSEAPPKEEKDYIASKGYQYLDTLDPDPASVLSKALLKVQVSKSGKSTRYEDEGRPIEIQVGGKQVRLPVSLVAYEGNDGIKNAWYVVTHKEQNRAFQRLLVRNGEVQFA